MSRWDLEEEREAALCTGWGRQLQPYGAAKAKSIVSFENRRTLMIDYSEGEGLKVMDRDMMGNMRKEIRNHKAMDSFEG